VFSNLVQPGDLYGPDAIGFAHTPAFTEATGVVWDATKFTPSDNYRLTNIEIPLGVVSGPNQVNVYLMSDTGGVPAQIIEAYTLSNLPPAGPNGLFLLATIASTLNPTLVSGTQYWIAATGIAPTFGLWTLTLFQGDPTAGGAFRIVDNEFDQGWIVGSGARTGALVVLGDPVPEPAAAVLLAAGLALIMAWRRAVAPAGLHRNAA
jgi:hypothetical protein